MSGDFEILNPDGTSNHLNAVCELIARPFRKLSRDLDSHIAEITARDWSEEDARRELGRG